MGEEVAKSRPARCRPPWAFLIHMSNSRSAVIVRLDRTIQYSRDARAWAGKPRRTGSPACAGDDDRMHVRDLAALEARGLHLTLHLPENRGRREDRVHAAPAVSCAKCANKNAHEHTGSAETLRPSLRSGFTAYFVLSPVNGSFATVIPKKLASRALDASTAASGPHDFVVRFSHARLAHASRPPHLTARSW